VHGQDLAVSQESVARETAAEAGTARADPRLNAPLPTGERRPAPAGKGLAYGVNFHSLMDRLTGVAPVERNALQRALGLPEREFAPMWEQAQRTLAAPELRRYFDASRYKRALNEVSCITADGEVRRIDRLVEFEDEVWVLDYKTGEEGDDPVLAAQYRSQLAAYRATMQSVYPGKSVRALLVYAGGRVMEA